MRADAEGRFGVKLEALYAYLRTDYDGEVRLGVAGEVFSTNGDDLVEDVSIIVTAHDSAGRVLRMLSEPVRAHGFYRVQGLSLTDYGVLPSTDVKLIKIYPAGY